MYIVQNICEVKLSHYITLSLLVYLEGNFLGFYHIGGLDGKVLVSSLENIKPQNVIMHFFPPKISVQY